MADRITLSRAKGWRMPENTRVVTRATIFGNPFVVGDPGGWNVPDGAKPRWLIEYRLDYVVGQYDAPELFRSWLTNGELAPRLPYTLNTAGRVALRLHMEERRWALLARLPELRGMNLACFCKPGCPCHADVLLDIANR